MEAKQFKVAALSLAVFGALASGSVMAQQDAEGPGYAASYEKFVDDSKLTGGLFYFQRNRQRYDPGIDKFKQNLNHAVTQAALNFNSGYAWDVIGLDIGGFGAYALSIDDANGVDRENEFNFMGSKYGALADGKTESKDGFSLSTAAVKLKFGDVATAKAGYTQLYIPGIIGVNWSYQPGTYLGGQVDVNTSGFSLATAYATEYKAPWYQNTAKFSLQGPYSMRNSEFDIDYIWGLSAGYKFDNGLALTAAFGQSENFMDSYFAKIAYKFDVLGGLNTSYQFYGSKTKNNDQLEKNGFFYYEGTAWQQALTAALNYDLYDFRAEALFTSADGSGFYLPRLTPGYGNSQGANEIWWDSRSDWNADNEKAIFLGVTRKLDDVVGAPGWAVGVSGAYGWDAEYKKANLSGGKESAVNFDVMYTIQEGLTKGTLFKLHYTNYKNHQDELGSWAYPNMFTSEHDVKFHIIMPLSFF
ncbi:outer membrane porin, OprD family [Plesiomonas shigelloides]|uniref:OprD family outer membrane porin n=1 Tax=Plesiomonas shigelloides TaxID=703 RepID=UPI0012620707|nr:OprD family outer membrane porin [Plesiomonas shigelloides]KAB7703773.1 outer membrane porin, OprD family [Plesiomonas shigelloides]